VYHGFEQATLDRIVIDDEHDFRHEHSNTPRVVPIWRNVAVLP
jgi:hypothetical protein